MKIKYLLAAVGLMVGAVLAPIRAVETVQAESCPKLRVVFARGSGGVRWEDENYRDFVGWLEPKLIMSDLDDGDYEFIDLDYPAIGINIENFWAVLGAYFGAGDTYEFGSSVNTGVKNLVKMVNGSCPDTKYVLAGYSQGAMVVSKAIHGISSDRIIYAATFGDPKIYLPEGAGAFPSACRGEGLSDYRAYVPDCHAYEGMLGSYRPYAPEGYEGKLGTWCNRKDIFCSSYLSVSDHLAYKTDDASTDLYRDASKAIMARINAAFGLESKYYSEHDTAILIDSTGSMSSLIKQYKQEALRLAEATLNSGGRVALYDYRDISDHYSPVQHCNFATCTLEKFQEHLDKITTNGGGDAPESLLSAANTVMKQLNWKVGATKSLVVLTDAGYHSPDRDGVTFADVVKLSKQIDPVNFYIITTSSVAGEYATLAEATDGSVAVTTGDLSLLTNSIMERYDSLPHVEEEFDDEEYDNDLPELSNLAVEELSSTAARVSFASSGGRALIAVNGAILGVAEGTEVVIGDLDRSVENVITATPLSETRRGISASVALSPLAAETVAVPAATEPEPGLGMASTIIIPKSPNTGRGATPAICTTK